MADLAKVILLYGHSGLGKSWMCADLAKNPACGEVYFSDYDGGLQSITKTDGSLPERVHVSPLLATTTDAKADWNKLITRKGMPEGVQTVVIDSLTALEQLFIAELTGHTSPWATGTMDQQKWGQRLALLLDYARLARSLPYRYVIFTAHQDTETDSKGNVTAILPLVGSSKAHEKFMAFCSHTLHMSMNMAKERILTLNNDGVIKAKCRAPALNALVPSGSTKEPLYKIIDKM